MKNAPTKEKTASSNIILPIKIPKRWPLSQKLSLMRVLPSAEMFLKIPNSGKIWKKYLNNPEHSIDNWQHLTRKVPPQYMGEMKNEHSLSPTQATNPRAASGSFIKQLRNGNNPKLTPQQNKPQQRSNGNQPLSVQQMIGNGYQRWTIRYPETIRGISLSPDDWISSRPISWYHHIAKKERAARSLFFLPVYQ